MAFAPVVAVAGLTLAWRIPRRGGAWLTDELALLGAFLLGLTPFLYLMWADATGRGLSYLKLVELAQWPVSAVPAGFRAPLARLGWLLAGRNEYPAVPFRLSPGLLAKNLSDSACLLALFEFGPVGLALALWGAWRRRVAHAFETRFLVALAAASIVFSVATSGYKILSIFLIPCYLVVAVLAGYGLEELHATLARGRLARVAGLLVLALPVAGVLLAQGARLASSDHPLGPLRSRVMEEDDIPERRLFPSMARVLEPRRFVESAAQALPESALVVCEWRELMALLYLQRVERRRTDLTLQPSGYPILLEKVGDWQARYPLASRPVVVVSPLGLMAPPLVPPDTLRLATGQPVVIARSPLVLRPPGAAMERTSVRGRRLPGGAR